MTALSRPAVRISAFAAGLAVVFGALFGVGRAVGPWDVDPAPAHHMTDEPVGGHADHQTNP